jgi:hypothetical protein
MISGIKTRGSLLALYSSGVRLQVGGIYLDQLHDMCLQEIQYLAYPIRSSFVIKDASRNLAAHADLCRVPRGLILWAGPPLAARPMYNPVGIGGYTPTGSHYNIQTLDLLWKHPDETFATYV